MAIGALGLWIWALGCFTMRYLLSTRGLDVRSSLVQGRVPWCAVEEVGRWEGQRGPWGWGLCRLSSQEGRPVLDFTFGARDGIIFIKAHKAIYLLAPRESTRFLARIRFFLRLGREGDEGERLIRRGFWAHPLVTDLFGQVAVGVALAFALASLGFLTVAYPHLPNQVALNSQGVGSLVDKVHLLRMPGTGVVAMGIDLLAAIMLYRRDRTAAQLLLAGGGFVGLLLLVAAVIGVVRA